MIQLVLSTFWLVRDFDVTVTPGRPSAPDFGGLLIPEGFTAAFTRR